MPLRQRFGWDVVGCWLIEDEDEFVFSAGHEDVAAEERRYQESSERGTITNPAQFLDRAQIHVKLAKRIL